MEQVQLQAFELESQLIDFGGADWLPPDGDGEGPGLRVHGDAPCQNMDVVLVPVRYVQQPDYWAIQVIGRLRGEVCLDGQRPFEADLVPTPVGKRGVVVVGQTRRLVLDRPPAR